MTGNPCTHWPGYKEYVIGRVPQLKRLDGEDVTKSVQLQAKQKLKQLTAELRIAAAENIEKKKNQDPEELKDAYTKEYRVQQYLEMQAQKEESDRKSKENTMFSDFRDFDEKQKKKEPISVYNPQGDIRQCNEGRYEFMFSESKDHTCILLEVQVPRFMDTSLINVDLHPNYIRMEIKGKVTQLKFEEEILVDKTKLQRSTTTGAMLLTMPKASISEVEARNLRIKQQQEERKNEDKLRKLEREQDEAKQAQKKSLDEKIKKANAPNKEESKKDDGEFLIRESKVEDEDEIKDKAKRMFVPDFDIDEVPPLE